MQSNIQKHREAVQQSDNPKRIADIITAKEAIRLLENTDTVPYKLIQVGTFFIAGTADPIGFWKSKISEWEEECNQMRIP